MEQMSVAKQNRVYGILQVIGCCIIATLAVVAFFNGSYVAGAFLLVIAAIGFKFASRFLRDRKAI